MESDFCPFLWLHLFYLQYKFYVNTDFMTIQNFLRKKKKLFVCYVLKMFLLFRELQSRTENYDHEVGDQLFTI